MRRTLPITFVILSILLEPQDAHAYLDPGTGSMLPVSYTHLTLPTTPYV